MERLKSILAPMAEQISRVRCETNGIVFVVHKPGKVARRAMDHLGIYLRPQRNNVFGLACPDAARAVGHDLVTRGWCEAPPVEDQVKVFLVAGNGTALLTLNFTDDGIEVVKEPDIYPVATESRSAP